MSGTLYTLDEVLALCKIYDIWIVERRDFKNQDFRIKYQVSLDEEKDVIRNQLASYHCVREAIEDRDLENNYLYVFKINAFHQCCYIKLTVDDLNHRIKVISFHESEV